MRVHAPIGDMCECNGPKDTCRVNNNTHHDSTFSSNSAAAMSAVGDLLMRAGIDQTLDESIPRLFARLREQGIVFTDPAKVQDIVRLLEGHNWHVGHTILAIKKKVRDEAARNQAATAIDQFESDEVATPLDQLSSDGAPAGLKDIEEPQIAECGLCGRFRSCSWCLGVPPISVKWTAPSELDAPVPYTALETALRMQRESTKGLLVASALGGSAWAQHALAYCHTAGLNSVPRDDNRAIALYEQAAAQGFAPAQCQLGELYERGGAGVAKDCKRAASFYALAADSGHAQAQSNLARMHLDGVAVSRNHARAVELLQLAAQQGHAQASTRLGMLYMQGRGVDRDEIRAASFLSPRGSCAQNTTSSPAAIDSPRQPRTDSSGTAPMHAKATSS